MSQLLERPPTQRQQMEYQVPVRSRSPVMAYTTIVIGALVALVGVYFQFAPTDWWLAHFSEAYQFASYTLGALVMSTGFGLYADWANDVDGGRSARVTTGIALAVLAAIGAVVAVVFWLI